MDKNRLRHLPPGLFADTPELWTILLHENDLTELPQGIFDGSPSLRRLDLSRNQLTELPSGIFDGTPKLARLGLDWNELTELPRGVFAGLSELDWVTLGDNPGAPFPVLPEFARIDVGDPLAPGPARVVARVPLGAPFRLEIPVSVQRGTISHECGSGPDRRHGECPVRGVGGERGHERCACRVRAAAGDDGRRLWRP